MKTFECACGNMIFFENTQCVACGHRLGWCPACMAVTNLVPEEDGVLKCGNEACQARLLRCHNYEVEKVCNRCFLESDQARYPDSLCEYCRFNDTIPDLSVAGNREKWLRLEEAKRRLLYTLDLLRLPYGTAEDGVVPALQFDFKADALKKEEWWWTMGKEERVFTGHANGKITINLREADPVEREKNRVLFQEAHRTVIGHFRHEIGHYYWEMLVKQKDEEAFKEMFGDFENPTYAEAQKKYYSEGPQADWQTSYISGYASMHPWEDFAETFAAYLDMVSVLDTAKNMGVGRRTNLRALNVTKALQQYIKLGVVFNELNRAMGLLDFVPDIFAPQVERKLQYVHRIVRAASTK